MVPPSLPSEDLDLIISLSLDTFFMAFAGTAVGLVLGIPSSSICETLCHACTGTSKAPSYFRAML